MRDWPYDPDEEDIPKESRLENELDIKLFVYNKMLKRTIGKQSNSSITCYIMMEPDFRSIKNQIFLKDINLKPGKYPSDKLKDKDFYFEPIYGVGDNIIYLQMSPFFLENKDIVNVTCKCYIGPLSGSVDVYTFKRRDNYWFLIKIENILKS